MTPSEKHAYSLEAIRIRRGLFWLGVFIVLDSADLRQAFADAAWLRRSKIFIATVTQIAVSSVGAVYHGQHLQTDLDTYSDPWSPTRCRSCGAAHLSRRMA
jgi:hypothetical protein